MPGFGATLRQVDFFAKTLRTLGFVVRVEEIPSSRFTSFIQAMNDPGTRIQAGSIGWTSDYIAASNFFEPLLTCDAYSPGSSINLNPGDFCDPKIDKEITGALAAQGSNSGASVSDWAQIDRAVVNQAPWVPVGNSETIDFVSRRVGDYQYNPQFGELADLLWVR
jgi:peptide/nickel transport system substrate-binding protein